MRDLDVVIIGGGIAGLSLGIFLIKNGNCRSIHLYEQAPEILPVGAAISVWSNGVKVLNQLGLDVEVQALGGNMQKMIYRDLENRTLVDASLTEMYKKVGERAYPVARGALQQMLLDKFTALGGAVTLGKIAIKINNPNEGKFQVEFNDGSSSEVCDLLVGADGIKSTIRTYVLGKTIQPVYHYTNWNGLIKQSRSIANNDEWVMWVGESKRASVMPVGEGMFYFFFGANIPMKTPAELPPRGDEKYREELKELFKSFPKPVQKVIAAIDLSKLNRVPICDLDSLESFHKKNVVLLGDAAHASTPTLGQGGCQALEDALVLSNCLIQHNVSIEDCLERYEKYRMKRSHGMVLKARERTATIFGLNGKEDSEKWYEELRQENIGELILNGMQKNLDAGPYPYPIDH